MFKNLFGPFPDEPLLYSFDKMIGLFQKIDSKLKRKNDSKNATNKIDFVDPGDGKITNVNVEATTANSVSSTGVKIEDVTGNDATQVPTTSAIPTTQRVISLSSSSAVHLKFYFSVL